LSEIRADTISDAAGTGPITLTKQSAAKAWVNFNGTSTVAIRDSENVSSLTDNGTGAYSANLTNSFSTTGYSTSGSIRYNSGIAFDGVFSVDDQLVSETKVFSVYGGTLFDSNRVSISNHGDLA
jgi:hypothetical protein